MAIYHLNVNIISRGKGRSVVAAAAYRSATKILDARQGLEFDYSKKRGVVYSDILAPADSPEWVYDREVLWNQIEASEKRINSQLAREMRLALPLELNLKENIQLVQGYVQTNFISQGMVADINVHLDNKENPHAHILLTTREISSSGFTQKNRSWNDKSKLFHWRLSWAEHANLALKAAGHEVIIDHRSYEEQGIDLEPTSHLGPHLHRLHQEKKLTELERLEAYRTVCRRNYQRLLHDPNRALHALTQHRSVFTEYDIAKLVHRYSENTQAYEALYTAILHHANIVCIGKTEQGKVIYTSRTLMKLEKQMMDQAMILSHRKGHSVDETFQVQALQGQTLNEGQCRSFQSLLKTGDLKILVGIAGSGKSTLLTTVQNAWQAQGYRVIGTALSGIATQNLLEQGIISRTVDSLMYAIQKEQFKFNANDILIVDEAGMLDTRRLAKLLSLAHQHQLKIVLVGDPEQLQPIQAGAAFRGIAERVGYSELHEVMRQCDPINPERTQPMREATLAFATHQTRAGLAGYAALNVLHEHDTREAAKQSVWQAWSRNYCNSRSQLMLAYQRQDVAFLNEKARQFLKTIRVLKEEHIFLVKNRWGEEVAKPFAVGERLYFLKNDVQLGVKNGSLGTLMQVDGFNITVALDQGSTLVFNLQDYAEIDHGYATTVHKSQGMTVDKTYLLTDHYFDRHVTYVAATRHRNHLEIHYDLETFTSQEHFYETLSRENRQDLVLDYLKDRNLDEQPKENLLQTQNLIRHDGTQSSASHHHVGLSVEAQTLLKEYLSLWSQRDESVRLKHRYWVSDRKQAKVFEAQALSFDETLQQASQALLEESSVIACLSESIPLSRIPSALLSLEEWQTKLKTQALSQADIHQMLTMIQHQRRGCEKRQNKEQSYS